ncbi:MAG: type II toxin-antitoxin system VapC family toxin [Planctomycetaceae bacterium]
MDASALLALLLQEPGAEVMEHDVQGAALSTVNYSEVLKKVVERGGDVSAAMSMLSSLGLDLFPFEEWHARDAAQLFPSTKDHGLSFADRACLALAIDLDGTLYTADKRLADVPAPIEIVLIRQAHSNPASQRKPVKSSLKSKS